MKDRIPIKGLTSTSEDMDHLWSVINERRATTKAVKVEVDSLIRVLTDFQKVSDRFKEID